MKTTFLKTLSIVVLILYNFDGFSQATITYTEDFSDFINPERGFYFQSSSYKDNFVDHYRTLQQEDDINDLLTELSNKKISLIQRIIRLDDYKNISVIPTSVLQKITDDFTFLRTNGLKCIFKI